MCSAAVDSIYVIAKAKLSVQASHYHRISTVPLVCNSYSLRSARSNKRQGFLYLRERGSVAVSHVSASRHVPDQRVHIYSATIVAK